MELKRLVIHCTATPWMRLVTPEHIRRWHTDPPPKGRGWKQVGYSDVIDYDGQVFNIAKYNEDDRVDPWEVTNGAKGYNSTSRHIVYIGGIGKDGRPADTRTPEQKAAMARYVKDFLRLHPKAEVVGHRDLDPKKACPCFDVRAWLKEIL